MGLSKREAIGMVWSLTEEAVVVVSYLAEEGMGMTAGHFDTSTRQCIVHTRKAKQRLGLAGRRVTQEAMA